jgi:membrane protein implicated in regulation of membrane protease activity
MDSVFTWSAIVGGTILVVQTILTALGVGLDELDLDTGFDLEHADAAHEHLLGALSLRALVAFATFFGLAGLAARSADFGQGTTVLVAAGAGLAAVFAVAQLMSWLARLQTSGNLDLSRAIGARGRVYLRIPAPGEGQGRIHVTVQGRRIEVRATSQRGPIPTGSEVLVVELGPDGALVVEPAA